MLPTVFLYYTKNKVADIKVLVFFVLSSYLWALEQGTFNHSTKTATAVAKVQIYYYHIKVK